MFLPQLRSRLNASLRMSVQRRSRHPSHLSLERLEERCLLTTLTVTTLSDAPTHNGISLRDAIADASPGDTVEFQAGLSGTITLTSAPLTINKILTIMGPGASVITVSGNHDYEVFNIPAPSFVTISGLTIANGSTRLWGRHFQWRRPNSHQLHLQRQHRPWWRRHL